MWIWKKNAQQCLLALLEIWKSSIEQGNVFGSCLTDHSIAFDCQPHDLFIAKMQAYGFNKKAYIYAKNRSQTEIEFLE